MQSIAANPYNQSTVQSVIDHIRGAEDEVVVLRVPLTRGDVLSLGENIQMCQTSRRKMMIIDEEDEQPGDFLNYINPHSNSLALTDLFRSDDDSDVIQSMGYTVIELSTDESPMTRRVVLTLEDLIRYLNTLGVRYVNNEMSDEADNWVGRDVMKNDGIRESTMYFNSAYRYMKLSKIQALAFLSRKEARPAAVSAWGPKKVAESALSLPEFDEKQVRYSNPYHARILVVRNDDCVFRIIPQSETYTEPESKARLLYLYDCLRHWVNGEQSRKVLKVSFIKDQEKITRFSYDAKPASVWHTDEAQQGDTFNDDGFSVKQSLTTSGIFSLFTHQTPGKTIDERLNAMKLFFHMYGLDLTDRDLQGDGNDYLKGGTLPFRLPTRDAIRVIAVIPQPQRPKLPVPNSRNVKAPIINAEAVSMPIPRSRQTPNA